MHSWVARQLVRSLQRWVGLSQRPTNAVGRVGRHAWYVTPVHEQYVSGSKHDSMGMHVPFWPQLEVPNTHSCPFAHCAPDEQPVVGPASETQPMRVQLALPPLAGHEQVLQPSPAGQVVAAGQRPPPGNGQKREASEVATPESPASPRGLTAAPQAPTTSAKTTAEIRVHPSFTARLSIWQRARRVAVLRVLGTKGHTHHAMAVCSERTAARVPTVDDARATGRLRDSESRWITARRHRPSAAVVDVATERRATRGVRRWTPAAPADPKIGSRRSPKWDIPPSALARRRRRATSSPQ